MAVKKKKSPKKTKAKKTKTKSKAKSKVKAKKSSTKAKRAAKPKASKRKASKPKVKAGPPKSASAAATMTTPSMLPDLDVQTTAGQLRLGSLRGKNVVLYFYPKDDTPGCTTEGCDIRDHYSEFQQLNTVALGVSRDDLDSHGKFKAKYNFPFELVSDPDEKLCKAFGVIGEKQNYGKTYMGIIRSTFVFDKDGKLRKEWRNVSVPGHIDQILGELKAI
jgi:thioredoxin-dependent peroxiredoxin